MKSQNLINKLSEDLQPFVPASLSKVTWKVIGLSLFFLVPSLMFMPWREDLATIRETQTFMLENVLWFSLVVAALIGFRNSLTPEAKNTKAILASAALFLMVAVSSLLHTPIQLAHDLPIELNLWQGRCGFVITALTLIQTPVMLYWAKHFAPNQTMTTGIFAALTSSALGCFLMQAICFHPESTHIILWHFLPLMALGLGSGIAAKKLLRW